MWAAHLELQALWLFCWCGFIILLYLGAEFAKQWALAFGSPILPSKYAETVQTVEVASKGETLQEAEKQKEIVEDAKKIAGEVVAGANEEKEKIIEDAETEKKG